MDHFHHGHSHSHDHGHHGHSHDHGHRHSGPLPARELLHERGLRATPQRVVILEVLAEVEGHGHLTARDVFMTAKDQLPGLNVTTVYRTLEGLNEAGLVDLMVSGHDTVRFAFRNPDGGHGHLVCHRCEKVLTLDMATVGEVARLLEERTGFAVDQRHLTLGGRCSDCNPPEILKISLK